MPRQNCRTHALAAVVAGSAAAGFVSHGVGFFGSVARPSRSLTTVETPLASIVPTQSADVSSNGKAATAVGGCLGLLAVGLARRGERRTRQWTRVTMLATDIIEKEEVSTEATSDTPKAEVKAKAAPKPKAKAEPKAKAAAKKPKKEAEPLVDQIFTGPWSPLITLGYWSVGEAFTKQVRSKGIVIHTKVIDAFCTTFNMSSKRKQNWIKLAKKTGHDQMGMLVDGGHFGDDNSWSRPCGHELLDGVGLGEVEAISELWPS